MEHKEYIIVSLSKFYKLFLSRFSLSISMLCSMILYHYYGSFDSSILYVFIKVSKQEILWVYLMSIKEAT